MARLLRKPDVSVKTGLKPTQFTELEKRGEFPRRVQISARAVGWVESEIDEWVRARIAERDAPKSNAA